MNITTAKQHSSRSHRYKDSIGSTPLGHIAGQNKVGRNMGEKKQLLYSNCSFHIDLNLSQMITLLKIILMQIYNFFRGEEEGKGEGKS